MINALSKRLVYIASFVERDMKIGDIGSDHGYLPFFLLENEIVSLAYACDNKKGPFNNLKSTFNGKYQNQITLALKSGLTDLPNFVDTVLITGMGGDLIISIIEEGKIHLSHINCFILSPQQNIPGVRRYLNSIGYKIIDEGVVFDDKYYQVIKAVKGEQNLSKVEVDFGPILLQKKENAFIEMYQSQIKELERIISLPNLTENRKIELTNEINYIKESVGI